MATVTLHPNETLLRRDDTSLVEGRLVSRTGRCYLTSRRIIVESEPLLVGVAGLLSIISRTILRRAGAYGSRRQEIPLGRLTRVALSKYGLNQTIDLQTDEGPALRMVMGGKQRREWLRALDEALQAAGLERTLAASEGVWYVR